MWSVPVMNEICSAAFVEIYAGAESPQPEILLSVPGDGINWISRKAGIVNIVMNIAIEVAGIFVQDAQTAIFGTNPKIAGDILI